MTGVDIWKCLLLYEQAVEARRTKRGAEHADGKPLDQERWKEG